MSKLMTVRETAAYLALTEAALRKLIWLADCPPPVRVRRRVYFLTQDVDAWVASKKARAA